MPINTSFVNYYGPFEDRRDNGVLVRNYGFGSKGSGSRVSTELRRFYSVKNINMIGSLISGSSIACFASSFGMVARDILISHILITAQKARPKAASFDGNAEDRIIAKLMILKASDYNDPQDVNDYLVDVLKGNSPSPDFTIESNRSYNLGFYSSTVNAINPIGYFQVGINMGLTDNEPYRRFVVEKDSFVGLMVKKKAASDFDASPTEILIDFDAVGNILAL